jgi:TctA family transporter
MGLDLSKLTTRAECDEVLESLAAEQDTYQHRDGNLDYADRQAGRTGITAQLAGASAEIAGLEAMLAVPGLTAAQQRATSGKLRRANDRRDNLTERGQARTGALAFLADVDAEQVAAQVTVLTNAQTLVTAHKATLSA